MKPLSAFCILSVTFRGAGVAVLLAAGVLFQGCVVFVPLIEEDPFSTQVEVPSSPLPSSSYRRTVKVSRTLRPSKVDKLIRSLQTGDSAARTNAATTLSYMQPIESRAVDALIQALSDTSKNVRRAAVKALGRLKAKRAVPHLAVALRDRDKYVAHSAKGALKKIGTPEAKSALQKAQPS